VEAVVAEIAAKRLATELERVRLEGELEAARAERSEAQRAAKVDSVVARFVRGVADPLKGGTERALRQRLAAVDTATLGDSLRIGAIALGVVAAVRQEAQEQAAAAQAAAQAAADAETARRQAVVADQQRSAWRQGSVAAVLAEVADELRYDGYPERFVEVAGAATVEALNALDDWSLAAPEVVEYAHEVAARALPRSRRWG
jgi:hypothetical protein